MINVSIKVNLALGYLMSPPDDDEMLYRVKKEFLVNNNSEVDYDDWIFTKLEENHEGMKEIYYKNLWNIDITDYLSVYQENGSYQTEKTKDGFLVTIPCVFDEKSFIKKLEELSKEKEELEL